MSKVERLLNLTAVLLETRIPITADDLRELVEGYPPPGPSFNRAFERDKDDLRTLGIPLVVESVAHTDPPLLGYRIPPEQYYLPDPGLEQDELAALNLAALTIRLDDLGSGEALWKLGASAGAAEQSANGAVATIPSDENLGPIFSAITARHTVGFIYRGDSRRVEPWRLDFQRGRWYLTGFDLDRNAERNFRLNRIDGSVTVEAITATAERPANETRQARQAWEIGPDLVTEVQLLVDADRVAWARQQLGEAATSELNDDGDVIFTVPVVQVNAFFSFVIGFLDHAEILGPPQVRADFIDLLGDMA